MFRDEELNDAVAAGENLHHIEGTVILHVSFAMKHDQELARQFIKFYKVCMYYVCRLCVYVCVCIHVYVYIYIHSTAFNCIARDNHCSTQLGRVFTYQK